MPITSILLRAITGDLIIRLNISAQQQRLTDVDSELVMAIYESNKIFDELKTISNDNIPHLSLHCIP